MAAALPILGAVAPTVIGALFGSKKQPTPYSSGLDPKTQEYRNWLMGQVQGVGARQQAAGAPQIPKQYKDAVTMLYKRFGIGNVPTQYNIPGSAPSAVPESQRPPWPPGAPTSDLQITPQLQRVISQLGSGGGGMSPFSGGGQTIPGQVPQFAPGVRRIGGPGQILNYPR